MIVSCQTAVAAKDSPAGDLWLLLEQESPPDDQQRATADDLRSMLDSAFSGLSAFRAVNSCRARRVGTTASWTATVLLHKSRLIDGYELVVTKDGELLEPSVLGSTRNRRRTYPIDYNATQQLGWQPLSITTRWTGRVYDESAQVVAGPEIQSDDGYLVLPGSPVFGEILANGLAEVDQIRVKIEHELGQAWSSEVWVEAYWPAGLTRGEQQSAALEIKLPQCVLDAFSECPDPDGSGPLGSGGVPGKDYWLDLNDTTGQIDATVYYNACTGEVLSVVESN